MIIWLTGPRYEDMTKIAEELRIGMPAAILYFFEILDLKTMSYVARSLEAQMMTVIACGGANTIAKRHEVSQICNPTWIHVHRKDHSNVEYEEPDPVKDTHRLAQDEMTHYESVRRIRYITGYTAEKPYLMFIGNFNHLTDEICAKIRSFEVESTIIIALNDIRRAPENPTITPIIARLQTLRREFGSSVKVITIPYAANIIIEKDGKLLGV